MDEHSSAMDMEMEEMLNKSWLKFPGHIAPATIFCAFGTFALVKTLLLTKQLPAGRSFTQVHIPFPDKKIVRNIGLWVMLLTACGALYHMGGEGLDTAIGIHMTLYGSFFMVGLVSVLESKELLSPDSGRAALSMACFLAGFVWRAHGLMMPDQFHVNQAVHVYLGYINFLDGFAFAYSIMRTDSILAHIASWALMVVQGIWLYVIAFFLCCIDIPDQMVEAYLCCVVICVTVVIALVIAAAGLPQVKESHRSAALEDGRGEYEVLTKFQNNDTDVLCNGSDGSSTGASSQASLEDQC